MALFKKRRRSTLYTSPYRRKKKSIIPLILIIIGIILIGWLILKLSLYLFSNVSGQNMSVLLKESSGKVEFQTKGEKENPWILSFPNATFLEGDRFRTGNNSFAEFLVLDGTHIFLKENSEIQFGKMRKDENGKNIFYAKLLKGSIWTKVSEDDFNLHNSADFQIKTDRSVLYVKGTVFDLSHSKLQDTLRLIKGNVYVDIQDISDTEKKGDPVNMEVGVGQKLVITQESYQKSVKKETLLDAIDSDFIESAWHLNNLTKFFPEEAKKIKRRIERDNILKQVSAANAGSNMEVDMAGDTTVPSPKIINPSEGTSIPAHQENLTIEGSAEVGTYQIEINGYTLTKFSPGDRKWSYFASSKFDTIKPGENIYKIVAITHDGKRSVPTLLRLNYEKKVPVATPSVTKTAPTATTPESPPTVTTPQNTNISTANSVVNTPNNRTYTAPVITSPAVFQADPSATYQTSSSVVTIRGTVPSNTQDVIINGFRLKKFKLGGTNFSYIANASYKNMREGENIYHVIAKSNVGQVAQTTIKIIYTPLIIK